MSILSRMRLGWGAGVALAAVVAALVTPGQEPSAAEPATAPPAELQYVPTDAAVFAHVDFAALWKSALGDTFRKAKLPALDAQLKELTALTGLKPDDVRTATFFMPQLREQQDMQRMGVVVTTTKAYDRAAVVKVLESHPLAKIGKYDNTNNVVRLTGKGGMPTMFADLSDDRRLVFGGNLKDEPKADPKRADGVHSATLKQSGAVILGGLNFANLPDEFRRDDTNFPPQMRAFLPIVKSESLAVVGRLTAKELSLSVAVRSPNKAVAMDVEKSLDILRGLAKTGLGEAEKEIEQAVKGGDDLKGILPLLKVLTDVVKNGKIDLDGQTATATLAISTDAPFATFVEFATGGKVSTNAADQNNLKQLGLSIHNYESSFGTMPPSYLVDKKGKPTLSWRVMVLPFIEQDQLYKKFKMDEPWDSEHNMKVYKDHPMPPTYLFPGDKAEDKTTRYRVFTGNGAAFDMTGKLKLTDFQDGTSNTILIATAATAVPWTKPDELEFDPEKEAVKLLHFKGERSNVAFADGSVRSLKNKVSEKALKAAITRGGGEVFDLDEK